MHNLMNMFKKVFSLGLKAARLGGKEAKGEAGRVSRFFAGELKGELKKASNAALRAAGRADKSLHERLKRQKSGKKKGKR
jgi:hypothetical protein